MAEDIDKVERARLARKEIIDHMCLWSNKRVRRHHQI